MQVYLMFNFISEAIKQRQESRQQAQAKPKKEKKEKPKKEKGTLSFFLTFLNVYLIFLGWYCLLFLFSSTVKKAPVEESDLPEVDQNTNKTLRQRQTAKAK